MSSKNMPTEKLIELNKVGLWYPRRIRFFKRECHWVLRDISFDVLKGETVGILGRNGAGKSTLLRLLANIISPDSGTITSKPSLNVVLLSIQAGFVFSLSGRENIYISGMTLGLSKTQIDKIFNKIVEFSELEDAINQPVGSYSTGMRARLGFSVAIQVDPDVLLVDEVISVGDEGFRKKASKFIQKRVADKKTTVVVTHDSQLVRELCTKALWLDKGTIRYYGDTDSTVSKYLANNSS